LDDLYNGHKTDVVVVVHYLDYYYCSVDIPTEVVLVMGDVNGK